MLKYLLGVLFFGLFLFIFYYNDIQSIIESKNINLIIKNLWIGNSNAARDNQIIRHIDMIINITVGRYLIPFISNKTENYHIPINDDLTLNSNKKMYNVLDKYSDLIQH